MKVTSWVIALALSAPATLLAQEPQQEQPPPMPPPVQPQDPQQPEPMPDDPQAPQPAEGGQAEYETKKTAEHSMKVKTHVLPISAGIDAADGAVSALHELAGGEQLNQQDARGTVQLADRGIQMALDRAQALNKMSGLSEEAKADANRASMKLREARTSVQQLQKHVGKQGRISQTKLGQIREQAKDVRGNLKEAEDAVESVAKAYDISTDLEMGG